jgi:hypothetical protein
MKLKKFVLLLTMIGTLSTMSNVNAGVNEIIIELVTNLMVSTIEKGFESGTPIKGAGVVIGPTTYGNGGIGTKVIINFINPFTFQLETKEEILKQGFAHSRLLPFTTFTIHGTINSYQFGGKVPIQWNRITNLIADPGAPGVADFDPEKVDKIFKGFNLSTTVH